VDLSSWSSSGGDRGAPLDFRLDGSHVAGARGRPRGIVHFVGGAFAGANPQLTVRALCRDAPQQADRRLDWYKMAIGSWILHSVAPLLRSAGRRLTATAGAA